MSTRSPTHHPDGLSSHWSHVWDSALKLKREDGTWSIQQSPLLDEYVFALQAAEDAREDGKPTDWDRHAKRAAGLADQLLLTEPSRRRHGIGVADENTDPFASFTDELEAKRRARVA